MPQRQKLPTAHMTPVEVVKHDEVIDPGTSGLVSGCKVRVFSGYTAPITVEVPKATPDGIPLPLTITQERALLGSLGEPCRMNDSKQRHRDAVEAKLIDLLESQGLKVASETRLHSVALFMLSDIRTQIVKRTLMLFPSVVARATREIEDQLTYILSILRQRGGCAREWVFNAGRHLLWSPGDEPLDAGLRLQAILRKFQNDVGRILRDPVIIGESDLAPLVRKTEACFYVEDDGSVTVHLHCHAIVFVRHFLKADDWANRLERARKSMLGRGWVCYLHDSKLKRAGTHYVLKPPQKFTKEDFSRKKKTSGEVALIDLPPEAIAAWAIATYHSHLIESYGQLAAFRATLKGDPSHNVPARALIRLKQCRKNSPPEFALRWKSDEPKTSNPETGRFGDDYSGNREGQYVDSKIVRPPKKRAHGTSSASRLFERPEGLLCPGGRDGETIANVRLVTVTRPARSAARKKQPRMLIATEWASLPMNTRRYQRRRALELMHARINGYRGEEKFVNPSEKIKLLDAFWRNLCARFHGRADRLLYLYLNNESSPEALASGAVGAAAGGGSGPP